MGRIGRSFQLVGQSYRMLMQDKELMVLPLMSGAIIAFVVVTLGFGFGLHRVDVEQADLSTYVPIFFMYVVYRAFTAGEKAADNPWGEGATTLEWTVSSPPPFHTFEELPVVTAPGGH